MKKINLFVKRSVPERIIFAFVFLIFAIVAAFYVYIYIWGFMSGLKTTTQIVLHPFDWPTKANWSNYIKIFTYFDKTGYNYWNMLFNSVYFSVGGAFILVFLTSQFAYVCTKYRFPCSKIFYPLILIMLTLPIYGNSGSQYLIFKRLNLINSYGQIICAFGGMNSWFLFFTALYVGVSDNYGEAAVIDGANDFQVYFKIMLPQARNLFLALFLTHWVTDWNNYSSVLLYLPKMPTLAGGIYLVQIDVTQHADFDMLYAGYMVSALPPLILFACFSNILTHSVSIGGVKE